jgi:NAD-dependent deacetylase sirtuin 2
VEDAYLMQILAHADAAQGVSLDDIIDPVRHERGGPVDYFFDSLPSNLEGVAEYIQSEKFKRILFLAGAGMSVASGIPDFCSVGGLYATLKANRQTCSPPQQEAIRQDASFALNQHLLLDNSLPLLETKRDFILGTYEQRWKATLAHCFVELLHSKTGKLL